VPLEQICVAGESGSHESVLPPVPPSHDHCHDRREDQKLYGPSDRRAQPPRGRGGKTVLAWAEPADEDSH